MISAKSAGKEAHTLVFSLTPLFMLPYSCIDRGLGFVVTKTKSNTEADPGFF